MADFSEGRLRSLLSHSHAKQTWWRHDVDYSLKAAVQMAELEQEYDIQSTFFLAVTSPYYNLLSAKDEVCQLKEFGHRLGLHSTSRGNAGVLYQEFQVLDEWFGIGFFDLCVSFHCPTEKVLWKRITGYESAYEPHWKHRYISDSRGTFSHGEPEDRMDEMPLQICLHPEWHFEPNWQDGLDPAVYEKFFGEPLSAESLV